MPLYRVTCKTKSFVSFSGIIRTYVDLKATRASRCTLIALGPVRVVPTYGGMTRPHRVSPRHRISNNENLTDEERFSRSPAV